MSSMNLKLSELPTPSLLLERAVLDANLAAMQRRMASLGVTLRPHLKTAKSACIANLASTGPITVSTLREAEYFGGHGITDITCAVGIAASRLPRAAALIAQGVDLKLLTDNAETASAVAGYAAREGTPFKVLIEIDSGGRRAGMRPDSDELLSVAQLLHQAPGVELRGVLTHAGQSYHCRGADAIQAVARMERDAAVTAARRLREAGLPCPVVSAGSTPTAVYAADLSGVNEMRPGVYMFNDLDQLALGTCRRRDLALSVLSTVIGHNRCAAHLVLDAGALALSKDRSAGELRPEVGYGEVCEVNTLAPYHNLFVQDVHQEHGMVPVVDPQLFDALPIGSRVRIVPNHACITAAAYDSYHIIENGQAVAEWDRINGW